MYIVALSNIKRGNMMAILDGGGEDTSRLSTSEKVVIGVLLVVFLALYLNIGWTIAVYFGEHIVVVRPENLETFWQKTMAGGWGFFADRRPSMVPLNTAEYVFLSFFWPFLLILIVTSWLAWTIWYLLWLIFAGGIAKLVGLG